MQPRSVIETATDLLKKPFCHSDGVVSLRCYLLNDDQIKELALALENDTYVRSLDLSVNKFGDVGVKALAAALEINRKITYLGITDNAITDEGYAVLWTTLQTSPPGLAIHACHSWGELFARQTLHNRWPTSHPELPEEVRLPLNYMGAWSKRGMLPLPLELVRQICAYFLHGWVVEGRGPYKATQHVFGTESYDDLIIIPDYDEKEDPAKWNWGDNPEQEGKELEVVFRDRYFEGVTKIEDQKKEIEEQKKKIETLNQTVTVQKAAISQFEVDYSRFAQENHRLRQENLRLQAENKRLVEENDFLAK